MSSFSLPPIHDNPDGGWGPSSSNIPDQFKFKDIPYAPYSKSDKLGRFADWNDPSSENRQGATGLPSTQNTRVSGGPTNRRKEGNQAFGSGTASAFAYFHVEDEASFSLVDNKAAPPRRGTSFSRGRGSSRGTSSYNNPRGAVRGGRGGPTFRGPGQRGGQRRGWRDWERVNNIIPCIKFKANIFCTHRIAVLESPQLLFPPNGPCWRRLNSIVLPNYVLK